MSKRLMKWVEEAIEELSNEYALAAGIDDNSVEIPDWLGYGIVPAIGFVIYDMGESDGSTNLYTLNTTRPNIEPLNNSMFSGDTNYMLSYPDIGYIPGKALVNINEPIKEPLKPMAQTRGRIFDFSIND